MNGNEVARLLGQIRALADEWDQASGGDDHVASCKIGACPLCVLVEAAADLRAALVAAGVPPQVDEADIRADEGERVAVAIERSIGARLSTLTSGEYSEGFRDGARIHAALARTSGGAQ